MDEGAPKEVIFSCKKCKNEITVTAHWKDGVHFVICKNCRFDGRYQLKNWKLK